MMELLCYTREALEDAVYAKRLGYSMHLAWREETTEKFQPFHHNEGILYAKAVSNPEDGTLTAKSLKNPWIIERKENGWLILAVRTEADGERDASSEGCVLLFSTMDFVHYEELGLIRLADAGYVDRVCARWDAGSASYQVCFQMENGNWINGTADLDFAEAVCRAEGRFSLHLEGETETEIPSIKEAMCEEEISDLTGAVPGNRVTVSEETGAYLKLKLLAPYCVDMKLSKEEAVNKSDLGCVRAVALYSDGSKVERKIDWTDIQENCAYGHVHQESFPAPFASHRADPVCMYRDGKYYFIATNDADGNHTLYMRESDTLQDIISAEEKLFLDSDTYPGIGGLLWAPEFHEIDGKLYVFHAATSGEFFCEESRVRVLRDGGNPICKEDWSEPKLVVRRDGTPLCEEGKVISLDMTTFSYMGEVYAMWSQRQFLPVDQGAWLYLAKIDPKEPWKLLSDPVCIAKPEYGWENNHTFVVEGPYALERDGQLMITYAAAAVDATYTVGLLKPVMGTDLLQAENWRKSNYPLLSSRSAEGEYGPGHNSYVTDENGLVWNFYHMRPGLDAPRSSAARRVHFDVDGEPMLDVTEELDLPERLRAVKINLKQA